MECVIDFQGFINSEKKFVIKEATVLLIAENTCGHWLVAPPIPFNDLSLSAQVFNDTQTKLHHGIEWFDGDVQARKLYANLREITRQMCTIFVHGTENTSFLENLIGRKVVDLEKLGCESAHNYNVDANKTLCVTHGVLLRKIFVCTMSTATFYKNWIIKNRGKIQEYFTPSSTIGRDTLSQALHATFHTPADLTTLNENEYFTTPACHQGPACGGNGSISSRSNPYELAPSLCTHSQHG